MTVESAKPEDLVLSEIEERFKGRWVAIEVTRRDKDFQPISGRVLESDVDRYMLREKTAKYADMCIFYAGDPPYRLLL